METSPAILEVLPRRKRITRPVSLMKDLFQRLQEGDSKESQSHLQLLQGNLGTVRSPQASPATGEVLQPHLLPWNHLRVIDSILISVGLVSTLLKKEQSLKLSKLLTITLSCWEAASLMLRTCSGSRSDLPTISTLVLVLELFLRKKMKTVKLSLGLKNGSSMSGTALSTRVNTANHSQSLRSRTTLLRLFGLETLSRWSFHDQHCFTRSTMLS